MEGRQTHTSYHKRSAMMWRLNMLVFFATIVYAIIDDILGVNAEPYLYVAFIAFTFINGTLIHLRKIEISKVFSLLVFNLMIFLVATSEPYSTGMYLHFVTAGTVALAVYGFEQWKGAITFVLISLVLDMIVFTVDLNILPWREFDTQQARIFFILNTLITVTVCVYTFMLYSKLNYEAEKTLQENEKLIVSQNEQLIKANSELDRFVYSASHDLRAPLSTLKGLINLSESESDDKMKMDYLNLMKKRIRSMDNFISEIIDYSRNSRLDIEREEINVTRLLEDIVEDLRYSEGFENLKIIWEFPLEIIIHSDEVRLKMIFNNLISNGIKYYDPDKNNPYIRLSGKLEDDDVIIIVEDNGIGISEEHLDNIFNMFYRAHDDSVGSGLGLYIARETLHKLNGQIDIRSEQGNGSKFIVKLPVTVPEPVLT